MVKNVVEEAENKAITIKLAVHPAGGSRHIITFMIILWGNHSIQIFGLDGIFQSEGGNIYVIRITRGVCGGNCCRRL